MRKPLAILVALSVSASLDAAAQGAPAPAGKKGGTSLKALYDRTLASRMGPLVSEVVRFPTVAGNTVARDEQKAWVTRVATELGLVVNDRGLVTEVELPGPAGAPVLGLVVHGDVQPVEASAWTVPPFEGLVKDGAVVGRGAADDKGPLVQALLAMKTLKESGRKRTHTVRLLVGSDEESSNLDISTYLKDNQAPDYSLVLDSAFPVVVGEKAWNSLSVTTPIASRGGPYALEATALFAGLATSIVPDRAAVTVKGSPAAVRALGARLSAKNLLPGTRLSTTETDGGLEIVVNGRSAHAGVNLEGGRNALVSLARLMDEELPPSGAADLLAIARLAGQDLYGSGFGFTESHPLWGRYAVNVATIKPAEGGAGLTLTINVRRTPPRKGPELKEILFAKVAAYNQEAGAALVPGGFFDDEPLGFDPNGKLVKRLLAAYTKAVGKAEKPAISGGGTYAKRLPNSIAFGMWFPGKPYPGHDVDEAIPLKDLHRGVHVLLVALDDLATSPRIVEPFKP